MAVAGGRRRTGRLSKTRALAVLASDNISIVAYATEDILLVLTVGGATALACSVPVALAVALVVAIVVTSYGRRSARTRKAPAALFRKHVVVTDVPFHLR